MFTTHGHWFPPAVPGEHPPPLVARCGGPGLCPQCAAECQMNRPGVLESPAPPVPASITGSPSPGTLEVPVDDLRDWYERYLEAKDAEAKIKDVVAEARSVFLEALARNYADLPDKVNMTIGGRPVLQRHVVIQNRVDTTKLRAEQPALAQRYNKEVRQEQLKIL